MQRTILSTTLLIGGTLGLMAQGIVDFSNAPWEAWPEVTPPDRLVYVGRGGVDIAVSDPTWNAALLEDRGGSWVQLGEKVPFFGPGLEGIWASDGIPRVISKPAGTPTTLQVWIYDGAGTLVGKSPPFIYTQGQSVPPSPTDILMVNFKAFAVSCSSSIQFAAQEFSVPENQSVVAISVTRSGSLVNTQTVSYATANGTGTAGEDYYSTSGSLTFGPGETNKTFNISLINDLVREGDETVLLTLTGCGSLSSATLNIQDDDVELRTLVSGGGMVGRNPDLLGYAHGAQVMLRAVPFTGWAFSQWADAASGTNPVNSVIMNSDLTVTANFTNASGCLTPASGMTGWWRAETNGYDQVGGNHASVQNAGGYVAGRVGQGFRFNGVDDAVVIPNTPAVDFTASESFTFEMWVRIDGLSAVGDDALLHKRVPGVGGYILQLVGPPEARHLEFIIFGPVFAVTALTFPILDANFHHVAVTLDREASKVKTYVDGVANHTNDITGFGSLENSSRLWVGHQTMDATTGVQPLHGVIDELTLYDRALSQAEIQAIYNIGSAGKCLSVIPPPISGMVSWWRAEDDAKDAVGPNHGTLQNGATFAAGEGGRAFSFDGLDDHVDVGTSDALLFQGSSFTLEGWVNFSRAADGINDEGIISRYGYSGAGGGAWILGRWRTGHLWFALDTDGTWSPERGLSPVILPVGTWHHVAAVYDHATGDLRLHMDGRVVAFQAGAPLTIFGATSARTSLGAWWRYDGSNGARAMAGLLDEPAVYNRALGTNEIAAIWANGSGGKYGPPLVAATPPRLAGGTWLGNGSFQFVFTNVSGVPFTVLGTTNLTLPTSNWTALGTATELPAGSGQYQFTDTNAAAASRRFYQVRSP